MGILIAVIAALLLALVVLKIVELKRARKELHVYTHPEIPHTRCVVCGLVVARYDERHVCANCKAEGK